jgi:diguanylate cyclase (GGDEF)-like protein
MGTNRNRIAALLAFLALEGILVTDPVRPWLPFSLWTSDAASVSAAGILAFTGLVVVGAFFPFSFPGLRPLPTTFPLIGTCLLLYGLPPAAALAAATVLLAQCRAGAGGEEGLTAEPPAPWLATTAGMGLGLLVADVAGFFLPAGPVPRGALDLGPALSVALFMSGGAAIASLAARYFAHGEGAGAPSGADWSWTLAAAPAAAGLSLAAAQAIRIWGLGPVALWLAVPFAAGAPLAAALARSRRTAAAHRRRADGSMEVLEAVALAIEAKDRTSASHLRRMRALACGIGRRLGMNPRDLEALDLAALLHDVGKLAVPESILSKPGRLTEEEFQKMTLHAATGSRILDAVPFARDAAPLVRHHHEHYDGSGYPEGRAGLTIPLGARILAVVDALDSITSERAYRRALGRAEALAFIQARAGAFFDPRVVRTLVDHYDSLMAEATAAENEEPPALEAHQPPMQVVLDTIASSHMESYSIHEIGQALGKALGVEESLSLIAGRLSRLFHFASCVIYVCDRESDTLVPRLAAGRGAGVLRTLAIPVGSGVSGWAAREKRSLIGSPPSHPALRDGTRSDLDDLADHPEVAELAACVVAPMMADQDVVGVLALYDTAADPYTPAEEKLLAMVGRQVGPAVKTGLLVERTQEHTLTDFLTGLPNTRYMFVAMEQELVRARDSGEPLSILVMDLDGFGRINEEMGHPAGDRYLIGVSKVIRSQMRDRDTCIRYAGDEFVAILPGVGREEAAQVAERIRRAVAAFALEGRPGRRARLTVSLGDATYSVDGETFEEMISAADERLARAKMEQRAGTMRGATLVPFRRVKPAESN